MMSFINNRLATTGWMKPLVVLVGDNLVSQVPQVEKALNHHRIR